jgi:hypothetical protein
MRWRRGLFLVSAFVVAGCSRSSSGTSGSGGSPTPAAALGDPVSEPGLFSFQAPKGWDTQTSPEQNYSSCSGPAESDGSSPSITVDQQGYQEVDAYVKTYMATLGASAEKSSFQTNSGAKGVRVIAKDGANETVAYVFPAKNGLLMVFTGKCLSADDSQIRPLFEASLKSLTLDSN